METSGGWSWDAYVAQINYYEYGMPLATIVPSPWHDGHLKPGNGPL
jgi:hypothetical protein